VDTPDNAIGYAMPSSRSHDAVIRVYDAAGNVIETHEHKAISNKHAALPNLDDYVTQNCRLSLRFYKISHQFIST